MPQTSPMYWFFLVMYFISVLVLCGMKYHYFYFKK